MTAIGRTIASSPLRHAAAARRSGLGRLNDPSLLLHWSVVAGLLILLLATPIVGRGDYGQWLMTGRYYLGEDVPAYRDIAALPPVVPLLLAAVGTMIPDAVATLQITNALLLVLLASSIYILAALLLQDRRAAVLAVAAAFLVGDRILELFAFGALLQVASLALMLLSAAAFVRAGQADANRMPWVWLGSGFLLGAALSHVGTASIAIPTGLATAAVSALRVRQGGGSLRGWLLPIGTALAAIGVYWLIALVPASATYLANPASLAYRGPERLVASLLTYWPNVLVLALGTLGVARLLAIDVRGRTIGGGSILACCVAVSWVAVLLSVVGGTATDFPRFSTVLLLPLAIGSGSTVQWAVRRVADQIPWSINARLPVIALASLILLVTPFAVLHFNRLASTYQPHDGASLDAAVEWIDKALAGTDSGVLTAVRDGKWLEGRSGREALFAQPVRYAFRRSEWQRSVDADVILRSTAAMASGYFRTMYTERTGIAAVPTSLLVGVNHGGEFVDLVRSSSSDLELRSAEDSLAGDTLNPVRHVASSGREHATLTTVWSDGLRPDALTQTVTLWENGTTMKLELVSPGRTLDLGLLPAVRDSIRSIESDGAEARVCFASTGDEQPCLRIIATQADAAFSVQRGALRFATHESEKLTLLITALTPGGQSVSLHLLDPRRLVEGHHLGAALLWKVDPSFEARALRLEALGFRRAASFGDYQVMLRDGRVSSVIPR